MVYSWKCFPATSVTWSQEEKYPLLTVLLYFWYFLNYWDFFGCVIFCCLLGCPALSAMHLVYFFSKPAFNLLWIFISDLCLPLRIFKQSFPRTSLCQRWFCCREGPFSINPAGDTSSLFAKDSNPPCGVLTCSSLGSVVSLELHLLSVLLKFWSGKMPVSWQCMGRSVWE